MPAAKELPLLLGKDHCSTGASEIKQADLHQANAVVLSGF